MLGGQEVTVVINGKVTTLSAEQLDALLNRFLSAGLRRRK